MPAQHREILYAVLRLQFGDRLANRWASSVGAADLPREAKGLLEIFLGRSATAAIPQQNEVPKNGEGPA